MPTSWIYHLKKPELIKEAEEKGIATDDLTVDQLRKLLVEFVATSEEFRTPPENQPQNMESDEGKGKLNLNKLIREWNLSYTTSDSAVEFIERLEELTSASGVEKEEVLPALPRILQGKALLWYRNNVHTWETWEEFLELFKLYYFPSNYEEDLIVTIIARKQRVREVFTDYVTDLQTLMRRYGRLNSKEMLHRIHENMLQNYKLYIKKNDYTDLPGLLKLAAEYEGIVNTNNEQQSTSYRHPYTDRMVTESRNYGGRVNTGPQYAGTTGSGFRSQPQLQSGVERKVHPRYDPRTCCWSCGKPGHDTRQCRSRQQLFCSGCGKLGVLSRRCCKRDWREPKEAAGAAGEFVREDNRLYTEVSMMGSRHLGLIDTGATNTYINQHMYDACRKQGAIEKVTNRGILLANGDKAHIIKSVLVDIEIKKATFKHWVRVLPTATGTILGMDVLRRVGIEITFLGGENRPEMRSQDSHDDRTTTAEAEGNEIGEGQNSAGDAITPGPQTTVSGDTDPTCSVNTDQADDVRIDPYRTLTDAQRKQLEGVLQHEFKLCDNSPKGNSWVEHKIKLKNKEPIKQKYFPRNPKLQGVIDEHRLRLYGRKLRNPRDHNTFPTPQLQSLNKIQEIYSTVREHQRKASESQKIYYDKHRRHWEPAIRELVLKKNHVLSDANKNFCAKLAPKYIGPYKIQERRSPVIYTLRKGDGSGRTHTCHVKDLKEYTQ
jgi:predicted aspartyl protease